MPAFSEQRDESAGVSPTAKTPALRWKEARRTHTYNVSAHVQGSDLSGIIFSTAQKSGIVLKSLCVWTISGWYGLKAEAALRQHDQLKVCNTAGITTPYAKSPQSLARGVDTHILRLDVKTKPCVRRLGSSRDRKDTLTAIHNMRLQVAQSSA